MEPNVGVRICTSLPCGWGLTSSHLQAASEPNQSHLFRRHRLCASGLDQPAVGVLQLSVQLLVLVQGLRRSKRQLSQEGRRVGGGLGLGPEADLPLHEVELIADEVVKVVLVAHAVVQHLQGLQAGRVFAHRARQVPHLFVVCKTKAQKIRIKSMIFNLGDNTEIGRTDDTHRGFYRCWALLKNNEVRASLTAAERPPAPPGSRQGGSSPARSAWPSLEPKLLVPWRRWKNNLESNHFFLQNAAGLTGVSGLIFATCTGGVVHRSRGWCRKLWGWNTRGNSLKYTHWCPATRNRRNFWFNLLFTVKWKCCNSQFSR